VSFLVVSAAAFFEVSAVFFEVSTAVFAALSAFAVESAAVVVELPLQAAAETAIARAKKPILNEFFMLYNILCFALIQQIKKGNPSFLINYIISM
jgi:hypothetical protein